jgi:hypothetical protein
MRARTCATDERQRKGEGDKRGNDSENEKDARHVRGLMVFNVLNRIAAEQRPPDVRHRAQSKCQRVASCVAPAIEVALATTNAATFWSVRYSIDTAGAHFPD